MPPFGGGLVWFLELPSYGGRIFCGCADAVTAESAPSLRSWLVCDPMDSAVEAKAFAGAF